MKILLAQFEVVAGRPDLNYQKIRALYEQHQSDTEVLAFPEMAIPGYLISDQWEDPTFLEDCCFYNEELRRLTEECVLVFGSVAVDQSIGEDGRPRRWNSAWIAQRGEWVENRALGTFHFPKTLMPNYREFDDSRYFYDLRKYALEKDLALDSLYHPISLEWINGKSLQFAPLLCEDSWDVDYPFSPSQVYASLGAEVLCNLSCSPYTFDKFQKRNRVLSGIATSLNVIIAYCNNVGIQNNGKTLFSFDGRSGFYFPSGDVIGQLEPWTEGVEAVTCELAAKSGKLDLSLPKRFHICKRLDPYQNEGLRHKYQALLYTIKNYMKQSGLSNVVIGVSGGVDSALSAALFSKIIPPENLYLVNMPSQYNSQTTINIARKLSENIGSWYMEVPIDDSVKLTQSQIDGLEIELLKNGDKAHLKLNSFHLENVQARDRSARVLGAIAASVGGVYPSNANKAETLVGYSTLYGDHGGFLVPLGDLWKEDVFELCHLVNQDRVIIPKAVFSIPPSAELSDAQDVDAGQGDPLVYEYHDKLFQSWIEPWMRESPVSLLKRVLEGSIQEKLSLKKPLYSYFGSALSFLEDLEKWWRLFSGMGVIKRIQAPTIIALSRRSFGYDYRESITPLYWGREYKELKTKVLDMVWVQ